MRHTNSWWIPEKGWRSNSIMEIVVMPDGRRAYVTKIGTRWIEVITYPTTTMPMERIKRVCPSTVTKTGETHA